MMIHKTLDRELAKTFMEQHADLRRTTNRYEKAFHPLKSGTSALSKMAQSIRAIALFVFTLGIYHCHVRRNTNRQWKAIICATAKNGYLANQSKDQKIQKLEDQLQRAQKETADFRTSAEGRDQKIEQLQSQLQKTQNESTAFRNATQQIKTLQDEKDHLEHRIIELTNFATRRAQEYDTLKAAAEQFAKEKDLAETKNKSFSILSKHSEESIKKLSQEVKDLKAQQAKDVQAQPPKEPTSNPFDQIPPLAPFTTADPVYNVVYASPSPKQVAKQRQAMIAAWQEEVIKARQQAKSCRLILENKAKEAIQAKLNDASQQLTNLLAELNLYTAKLDTLENQEHSEENQQQLDAIKPLHKRLIQICTKVDESIKTLERQKSVNNHRVRRYA